MDLQDEAKIPSTTTKSCPLKPNTEAKMPRGSKPEDLKYPGTRDRPRQEVPVLIRPSTE